MREWHISIPRSIDDKEWSAPQAETERPHDIRIVVTRLVWFDDWSIQRSFRLDGRQSSSKEVGEL